MAPTLTCYLKPEDGLVFRALAEAVYHLLQTQSIDSLSISDLVKRAGVSRASFYRHFADKYDLVRAMHRRALEGSLLRWFQGVPFQQAVEDTWQIFTRHKRFYRNALISTDVNALGNYIFDETYSFYREMLRLRGVTMDKVQSRELRQYCFGAVALLSEWILGEMGEPLEEYMKASIRGLPAFVGDCLK